MGRFGSSDWEEKYINDDDGPMIGGADRREERIRILERAKEIASGYVSGMFERDESVLDLVRKIQSDDEPEPSK